MLDKKSEELSSEFDQCHSQKTNQSIENSSLDEQFQRISDELLDEYLKLTIIKRCHEFSDEFRCKYAEYFQSSPRLSRQELHFCRTNFESRLESSPNIESTISKIIEKLKISRKNEENDSTDREKFVENSNCVFSKADNESEIEQMRFSFSSEIDEIQQEIFDDEISTLETSKFCLDKENFLLSIVELRKNSNSKIEINSNSEYKLDNLSTIATLNNEIVREETKGIIKELSIQSQYRENESEYSFEKTPSNNANQKPSNNADVQVVDDLLEYLSEISEKINSNSCRENCKCLDDDVSFVDLLKMENVENFLEENFTPKAAIFYKEKMKQIRQLYYAEPKRTNVQNTNANGDFFNVPLHKNGISRRNSSMCVNDWKNEFKRSPNLHFLEGSSEFKKIRPCVILTKAVKLRIAAVKSKSLV